MWEDGEFNRNMRNHNEEFQRRERENRYNKKSSGFKNYRMEQKIGMVVIVGMILYGIYSWAKANMGTVILILVIAIAIVILVVVLKMKKAAGKTPAGFTGKGKETYETGVYEGDFVDGKRHGKGKVVFSNGGSYEGDFVNGDFNGRGKLITPDGTVQEGQFKDGNFLGLIM